MKQLAMVVVWGFALVLGASAVAQEEPATPKQPLSPIAKELDTIRKMLTNAQAKLNRGAVGIEAGSEGQAQTPGRQCCSGNLQHIDKGIAAIRTLVRERGICFERRRDREGIEVVNLVNQDLRSLSNAVQMFADSTERAETQGALYGTTRSFLNLKRSTESLQDCSDTP
jgi:hypothetical protein